ncbi:MAG: hypothetical protein H7177_09455 [Rhizobacter sp.]|nr:hypothetical protein [Bacteriovorax sp.]
MINHSDSKQKFITSLVAALIVHAAILAFVKRPLNNFGMLDQLSQITKRPVQLDQIKFISHSEVEKYRTVGIKGGKKELQRPDIKPKPIVNTPAKKGSPNPLSMESLAPQLPKPTLQKPTEENKPGPKGALADKKPEMAKAEAKPVKKTQNDLARDFLNIKPTTDTSSGGHFYFNYKQDKVIPRTTEQEELKTQASKNFTAPQNKATDRISNFEIRYERPEGVSEDELNSDEKAYYSFYVRSYQNYFSKIYANYEKIVVERPGLAAVFDKRHLLIGKIDYDQEGNIVTVKILKSDESDDLHYFFEETLKQLSQPNPPKVFTKNRKQFSIFYQLQIN